MKVLLINGSPKAKGCTFTALSEVAQELEKEKIQTEIFHVGNKPIRGCIDCRKCVEAQNGRCSFNDDPVNEALEKAQICRRIYFWFPGALCRCLRFDNFVLRSVFLCRQQRFYL